MQPAQSYNSIHLHTSRTLFNYIICTVQHTQPSFGHLFVVCILFPLGRMWYRHVWAPKGRNPEKYGKQTLGWATSPKLAQAEPHVSVAAAVMEPADLQLHMDRVLVQEPKLSKFVIVDAQFQL